MKYTVLVIDDSSIQRLATSILVKNHPQLKLLGAYGNPYEGIKAIYDEKPDMVFMDVLMDNVDAFELLDSIEVLPPIILNSTWSKFAARAFDYGINDFLMKPMPKKRFDIAIKKVISQIEQAQLTKTKTFSFLETYSEFNA
ncbi:LytR/AlgR family response regulator transcription factor [Flagellimonas flava]|uniref:Response regulator receiver domain-containing protein n=1 Tax=Flagellimonas flava TaxID=570519 RepID=A0A1M5PG53_9FLAO|nr:response regulator [Allomuricauda flava]SHH00243.1 Response regulator receiver domain-containing protein [Allomuricauda flava]